MAEIADRAGIDPALRSLQFADNLHRAYLGRAGDRARRESRAQRVEGREIRAQLAGDVRYQVHDVRIALDLHKLRDLYTSRRTDAPDIVAAQVCQHDMLGALLWIVEQL